ncbi:LysM peptidoglycan-binding domain-containing protein [Hyalangium versicolor]|uniref:LysM peptidoglycan-binding domain-containing protein n=1 Tax=Hyalangium versicolor TaxID=2861190 RepID=UPI001CCF1A2D|nr:LysM peptidoglycan-binding domain-containing protein [Hyalangium versicolor]
MVWGPNAGVYDGSTGKADGAGHVAVVESVTPHPADAQNPYGSVTVRVSERNWDRQDGQVGGVPYRDIDLPLDAQGKVVMPPGVGFVPLAPSTAPAVNTPAPSTGPQNPALGPNPTHANDPSFQMNNTAAHDPHRSYSDPSGTNSLNNYTQCVGYIHDMPQFGPLIESLAAQQTDNHYLSASEIPGNSRVPTEGSLMIWQPGPADATLGGKVGRDGHVAYVEDVQRNYDPPGDPTGKVVSYTLTISEANASGSGNDDRSLRTFTIAADANGQPVLPDSVSVYDPNLGRSNSPSPATGVATPSQGSEIAHGSSYTVASGDTLTSIASRAHVTVDQILAANPSITNPDMLSLGQRISIP